MDVLGRIRALMAERGWSEYRLAKEANLSHSTITHLFNRNNTPTFPTLVSICGAFGMTLAQFFAVDGTLTEVTPQQRVLLDRFSALTDAQRQALLQLLDAMQ